MTRAKRRRRPGPSASQLADALVRAAATARWPDGSLLLDLHETVLRTLLAPHLTSALAQADRADRLDASEPDAGHRTRRAES